MQRLKRCPVCASTKFKTIWNGPDAWPALKNKRVRYDLCSRCSVAFTNPWLEDDELSAAYGQDYWKSEAFSRQNGHWKMVPGFVNDRLRVAVERHHYMEDRGLLPKLPASKRRMLEIGCGAGFLLRVFRGKGWKVQGVEPTPLARFGRKAGIPTEETFFTPELFGKKRFGLIGLMQVFEHLKDPVASLKQFGSLLAPGGRLWLEVPNLRYPRPADFSLLHLYYYTPDSLRNTLELAGFKVHHCEAYNSRNGAFQVVHAVASPSRSVKRPTFGKENPKEMAALAKAVHDLAKRKETSAKVARSYHQIRLPAREIG